MTYLLYIWVAVHRQTLKNYGRCVDTLVNFTQIFECMTYSASYILRI